MSVSGIFFFFSRSDITLFCVSRRAYWIGKSYEKQDFWIVLEFELEFPISELRITYGVVRIVFFVSWRTISELCPGEQFQNRFALKFHFGVFVCFRAKFSKIQFARQEWHFSADDVKKKHKPFFLEFDIKCSDSDQRFFSSAIKFAFHMSGKLCCNNSTVERKSAYQFFVTFSRVVKTLISDFRRSFQNRTIEKSW